MQKKPKTQTSPDSLLYSSLLSTSSNGKNPIQAIFGDFSRMIHTLANLHKNRQAAQFRINDLQEQANKVESAMSSATVKPTGSRFDRTR